MSKKVKKRSDQMPDKERTRDFIEKRTVNKATEVRVPGCFISSQATLKWEYFDSIHDSKLTDIEFLEKRFANDRMFICFCDASYKKDESWISNITNSWKFRYVSIVRRDHRDGLNFTGSEAASVLIVILRENWHHRLTEFLNQAVSRAQYEVGLFIYMGLENNEPLTMYLQEGAVYPSRQYRALEMGEEFSIDWLSANNFKNEETSWLSTRFRNNLSPEKRLSIYENQPSRVVYQLALVCNLPDAVEFLLQKRLSSGSNECHKRKQNFILSKNF